MKSKIIYNIYLIFDNIYRRGKQIEKERLWESQAVIHDSAKIYSEATLRNLSTNRNKIVIGDASVVKGELVVFAHGGEINIGQSCYIGEGSRIWSAQAITIGDRVLISHGVNIHDTNSHSVDAKLREKHFNSIMSVGHPKVNEFDIESRKVTIGNDVWIGFNSTILKGVSIGGKSIIAACSVVTKDVPECCMAAGNPARIVKHI